jgi:hypothetical protein
MNPTKNLIEANLYMKGSIGFLMGVHAMFKFYQDSSGVL